MAGKRRKQRPRSRHQQVGPPKADGQTKRPENLAPLDLEWDCSGLPYEVRISPVFGRYLCASRDIKAGELVLEEEPLIAGPSMDIENVCLDCFIPLAPDHKVRCPGCSWPLCSPACPRRGWNLGHSPEECAVLAKSSSPTYNTSMIAPLRGLLLRETAPQKWSQLVRMEAQHAHRRVSKIWASDERIVSDLLRLLPNFNELDAQTMCGVLEVNAFEVGDSARTCRAVYPRAFLLAHNCVPNTSRTDNSRLRMRIRAATDIAAGEPLTTTYAYVLQGTVERREHLFATKFFWCECQRCKDPTELNTKMSAIRCAGCGSQDGLLPSEPLRPDATWRCYSKTCNYTEPASNVRKFVEKITVDVYGVDQNDADALEKAVARWSPHLGPSHYLLAGLHHSLVMLYGRAADLLPHMLSDDQLLRKASLCRSLLKLVDVIQPGRNCLRGILLYEEHAPLMVLAARRAARGASRADLRTALTEVEAVLAEAADLLGDADSDSEEGGTGEAARNALTQLRCQLVKQRSNSSCPRNILWKKDKGQETKTSLCAKT